MLTYSQASLLSTPTLTSMATARPRLPRAERAEQVLEVAYETFAQRGYDGASMREIAVRAGVTQPILYAHHGSKDGLFAACVERMVEPMLSHVRAATDPRLPPDGQLWAGILAQLGFIEEHRAEWRAFVREAGARGGLAGAALSQGRERVVGLLGDLIEQAARAAGAPVPPRKEVEASAHMLQGAVEQIASWWERYPEERLESVALRAMNLTWQGFGDLVEARIWLPPRPPS